MAETSWSFAGKQTEQEETPAPETFTTQDVERWLSVEPEKYSNICAVLYGADGTGKTGAAMDCWTKEALKENKKIIVFDLDGSAGPIKSSYHKNNPNIVIFDPVILTPRGDIDYVTTYNKVLAVTKYLSEKELELGLHAVVFDGLDTFLKICEYVMRYEDLKLDPDTQIKDNWQWARRNRRYLTVVLLLKKLSCEKYFTTHLKEQLRWVPTGHGSERVLQVVGTKPDWERTTPGIMFQKIAMERKEVDGKVILEAKVEKAKGRLELEGALYTVAIVEKGNTQWFGLNPLYDEFRKVA